MVKDLGGRCREIRRLKKWTATQGTEDRRVPPFAAAAAATSRHESRTWEMNDRRDPGAQACSPALRSRSCQSSFTISWIASRS